MADLTDEMLPGYCIIHCETEVAQFHKKHIARLCRLAGMNEEADAVEQGNEWLFLGPNIIRPIVEKIRSREADGDGR